MRYALKPMWRETGGQKREGAWMVYSGQVQAARGKQDT